MARKTWIEKYAEYVDCYNLAVLKYEYAEKLLKNGRPATAWNQVHWSWFHLFEGEAAKYIHDSTPKQQKQRKLWVERGLLERTLANVESCLPLSQVYPRDNLVAARATLQHMIEYNKHQMKSL